MTFPKLHYDTEGPLGLPMKDKQARMLEALLKTLPPRSPPARHRQGRPS
jgi:hypothetical protein